MNQSSLRSCALLAFGCALAALGSLRADEDLTTSSGTFRLPEATSLHGSTAVRSALRTVELASAAVADDARKALTQVNEAAAAIETHNGQVKDYLARVGQHNDATTAQDAQVQGHLSEIASYEQACSTHNARADASNALAPEDRDAGTVASINAEQGQLRTLKQALEARTAELNQAAASLNDEKAQLDAEAKDLDAQSAELNRQRQERHATLGEAYRQLQVCFQFSQQARDLAERMHLGESDGFSAAVIDLTGTIEKVKALAGAGFDGNTTSGTDLKPEDIRPPSGASENQQQ